ncbi:MAG: hypothetical protein ACKOEO_20425 [Planctomycetaceae bacterium]
MDVMTLPLLPHQFHLPFTIGSFCVLDFRLSAKPMGWAGKNAAWEGKDRT